jgi:hypothetical protein
MLRDHGSAQAACNCSWLEEVKNKSTLELSGSSACCFPDWLGLYDRWYPFWSLVDGAVRLPRCHPIASLLGEMQSSTFYVGFSIIPRIRLGKISLSISKTKLCVRCQIRTVVSSDRIFEEAPREEACMSNHDHDDIFDYCKGLIGTGTTIHVSQFYWYCVRVHLDSFDFRDVLQAFVMMEEILVTGDFVCACVEWQVMQIWISKMLCCGRSDEDFSHQHSCHYY